MEVKSVELMRNIRTKISQETQGMSWAEESAYLDSCGSSLYKLLKQTPTTPTSSTSTNLSRFDFVDS
jgi:hypothetical protein